MIPIFSSFLIDIYVESTFFGRQYQVNYLSIDHFLLQMYLEILSLSYWASTVIEHHFKNIVNKVCIGTLGIWVSRGNESKKFH